MGPNNSDGLQFLVERPRKAHLSKSQIDDQRESAFFVSTFVGSCPTIQRCRYPRHFNPHTLQGDEL